MSYKVVVLPEFANNLKKLAKKYKKIKNDFKGLIKELEDNPNAGIHLTNNCYKIRVSNSSIPTGKSGGFRVIYYYLDNNNNIFLMSIYSKTQQENISDSNLIEILEANGLNN